MSFFLSPPTQSLLTVLGDWPTRQKTLAKAWDMQNACIMPHQAHYLPLFSLQLSFLQQFHPS